MNSKSIVVFILIFLVQLIISCNSCGHDPVSYEIEYTGIIVHTWDTSGFYEKEVKDSVSRNSFGLSFYPNYEMQEIAHFQNNFSFSAALACDPAYPAVTDPIDYAEIYVTDIVNDTLQNVTELFGAYMYTGELTSVSELFASQTEWFEEFRVELIQPDSIPPSAVFSVHLHLESGIMLSADTQQVNFYD